MNSLNSVEDETSKVTYSPRVQIKKTKIRNISFAVVLIFSLYLFVINCIDVVNLLSDDYKKGKGHEAVFITYIFVDIFVLILSILVTFILRLYSLNEKPTCLLATLYISIVLNLISTGLFLYTVIEVMKGKIHFIRIIAHVAVIAGQIPFIYSWGGPLFYVVKDDPPVTELNQPILNQDN